MEFLGPLSGMVIESMNTELTREFNKREIFSTLNHLHPTKSPDPYGTSPLFFRSSGIL